MMSEDRLSKQERRNDIIEGLKKLPGKLCKIQYRKLIVTRSNQRLKFAFEKCAYCIGRIML